MTDNTHTTPHEMLDRLSFFQGIKNNCTPKQKEVADEAIIEILIICN
jgi:hypothetical protein|tara:strand:- start:2110 stop:2250 length:141 start_codon:yes stop_codon:yes gene_type:complete